MQLAKKNEEYSNSIDYPFLPGNMSRWVQPSSPGNTSTATFQPAIPPYITLVGKMKMKIDGEGSVGISLVDYNRQIA